MRLPLVAAAVLAISIGLSAGGAAAPDSLLATAAGEPGGYSPQDETFFRLLTTPDDDGFYITVTNPALIRAQGLTVCQLVDNGMAGLDAIYALMAQGPYSFDAANSISSAAKVAYCQDNLGR